MPNTLPLTIQFGSLPLNFQGTPQQFADAIAARLSIITQQSLALFVSGTTEPSSDVGPWYNTSTNPGIWYGWNPETGNYQPLPVADITLRYILSSTEPDPDVFQLWVKLSPVGEGLGVYTYYNGAWHDVYEDVIATLTAAASNVFKPYGVSGTILTSTGPDTAPVWGVGFPIGAYTPYGGATAPTGWLTCDGSLKAIASYPALFAAIGALWGGDGITTFAVPNMPGRIPIGIGTAANPSVPGATPWSQAQVDGGQTTDIAATNLPASGVVNRYTRGVADGNAPNAAGAIVLSPGGGVSSWTSDNLGDGTPLNVMNPVIGTHWIIRAQ